MRVLLAGGGTGGHLYPLLVVANKLREMKGDDVELLYIGPTNRLSKIILEENGIKTQSIVTAKWRRYFSIDNFIDIFRFPISLAQSLFLVWKYMPDVVFSKGGFGSITPTIAARLYWIPILIHESDAVPGFANRFIATISDVVATSFEESALYFKKYKVLVTGNPIRKTILEGHADAAREKFGLHDGKPIILVLGGSQGSQLINNKIVEILPRLLRGYQVIHQVGEGKLKDVEHRAGELGIKIERSEYHPVEYLGEEITDAYQVSDLVISRAGAGSITEIAAAKKPSILVPLGNSANGHQVSNAYQIAKAGGAVVLEENNLEPNLILSRIDGIMSDSELRETMSLRISRFYYPDASDKISENLIHLAES